MNTHGLFNDPTGIRVHINGAIIGKLSCLYHNELLQIIPFDALGLHFLGNIMGWLFWSIFTTDHLLFVVRIRANLINYQTHVLWKLYDITFGLLIWQPFVFMKLHQHILFLGFVYTASFVLAGKKKKKKRKGWCLIPNCEKVKIFSKLAWVHSASPFHIDFSNYMYASFTHRNNYNFDNRYMFLREKDSFYLLCLDTNLCL